MDPLDFTSSERSSPEAPPQDAGLRQGSLAVEIPAESQLGEWLASLIIVAAWSAIVIVQALHR
jgi:hypothetical protein